MNNLLQMILWMWNFSGIKDRLIQLWIPQETLQWVDFSNMQSLNDLAQKIMPWLLASNKQLAWQIKNLASMLWNDKQKEVGEIIDMM